MRPTYTIGGIAASALAICVLGGCAARKLPAEDPAVPSGPAPQAVIHLLAAKRAERNDDDLSALVHWQSAVAEDQTAPSLRLGLARAINGVGGDSAAVSAAMASLALDSTYADAHRFLAELHEEQERFRLAVPHREAALRISRDESDAWSLIHLYRAVGRPADAQRTLKRLAREDADSPYDMLRWATIARRMKLATSADTLYRIVLERWPDLERGAVEYGEFLDEADRADEAIAVYTNGLERHPDSHDLLERLAWLHTGRGKWALADSAMVRVTPYGEHELTQRRAWLSLMLKRGQHEIVASHIERLLLRFPDESAFHVLLGQAYIAQQRFPEAAVAFEQAARRDSTVEALTGLLLAYLQSGAPSHAERAGRDAVERYPGDTRLRYLFGIALRSRSKWEESAGVFASLLADDADNTTWMFNYASSLERAGRYDEAVPVFRRLISRDSQNAVALNYLGYMFAERGIHLAEAHRMIARAVALEPENSAYLDSMGWVLYQQGKPLEGRRYLLRAAELDPTSALIFEHLGDVNHTLGEDGLALAAWIEALRLEPTNEQVRAKVNALPRD